MLGNLYDRALDGERCWLRHDDTIIPFDILVNQRFGPPTLADFLQILAKRIRTLDHPQKLKTRAAKIHQDGQIWAAESENPGRLAREAPTRCIPVFQRHAHPVQRRQRISYRCRKCCREAPTSRVIHPYILCVG